MRHEVAASHAEAAGLDVGIGGSGPATLGQQAARVIVCSSVGRRGKFQEDRERGTEWKDRVRGSG